MENVGFKAENGMLTIFLKGRIDSVNASAVDAEINRLRKEYPAGKAVIDCEKLEYLSSAGLRVLLHFKKAVSDVKLINVSSEVYEILDMTGFTEIMEVEKAFRIFSMKGCEVIGEGANGTVCRYDRDTIVKTFKNPDALPEIRRERELARIAFVLGVPTAISYDVVRIEGGGYGAVYELLDANSLGQLLSKGAVSVEEAAKISIDLLKIIHSTVVDPDVIPDMKKTALKWADFLVNQFPEDGYEKLRKLVEEVPDDNHLLHGDYHIKNIMIQDGESLLIDMDTLCHGNPVFELASMFNAYIGFSDTDHSVSGKFLGIPYETSVRFWKKSLRCYFEGADEETILAAEEKAMILGYARILRRRVRRNGFESPEGRLEIENCRMMLKKLLPKTDTLVF